MSVEHDAVETLKYLQTNAGKIAKDFPKLAWILPLAGVALHAIHEVKEATGADTSHAVQAVASTITPGLPNSPVLTDSTTAHGEIDAEHIDAAADAADAKTATHEHAVQAVQAMPLMMVGAG